MIQECRDLTVDESVFTGSNKPMAKYAGGISKSELKPTFVYSGTKILTGVAVCKVSATGVDTKYYHKVGEPTPKHCYYTTMERIIQKLLPLCSATAAVLALISMVAWYFTATRCSNLQCAASRSDFVSFRRVSTRS